MIIETKILDTIKKSIDRYQMFSYDDEILLALSGGKDSLFSFLTLRELGFRIFPVVIDMGYEESWDQIILNNFSEFSINPKIVKIRDKEFQNLMSEHIRMDLNSKLNFLDKLESFQDNNITPCTACYNSKITALSVLASPLGITKIVFGHHATDAITSFLKSAIMYIDRWDFGHNVFNRNSFENTFEEVRNELLQEFPKAKESKTFKRLNELSKLNLAATDEPPVQTYSFSSKVFKIVRPLFNVFEESIKSFRDTYSIATAGSGCGHSILAEKNTPREIIQSLLVSKLLNLSSYEEYKQWLLALVHLGLKEDGTLIRNVRNERASILGKDYKDNFGCNTKF